MNAKTHMTDAEKAYKEAERLIAVEQVARTGELALWRNETKALTALPPEISELHWLSVIDFSCPVSDLTPIKNLTALERLSISSSQVKDLTPVKAHTRLKALSLPNSRIVDLSPLQSLASLGEIFLDNTNVEDISVLQSFTKLEMLSLPNTQVKDITALASFSKLFTLNLANTPVADISALKSLTNLNSLNICNTQVTDISAIEPLIQLRSLYLANSPISDLRPCGRLSELGESTPLSDGIFFGGTLAVRLDPKLLELSKIKDHNDRTRITAHYLNSLDDAEYDAFLEQRKRELGIVEAEGVSTPPKTSTNAKARAALLAPNLAAHRQVILPLADQIQTALRTWQNETGANQLPEELQLVEHLASGFALAVQQGDIQDLEARLAYLEAEGQKLAVLLKQEQAKTAALSHELSEAKAAKFGPAYREQMGKGLAILSTAAIVSSVGLGVTYILGEAHPITKALVSAISA
jgi:Leucine Rich repeats (2 copies)